MGSGQEDEPRLGERAAGYKGERDRSSRSMSRRKGHPPALSRLTEPGECAWRSATLLSFPGDYDGALEVADGEAGVADGGKRAADVAAAVQGHLPHAGAGAA